MKNTIKKAPIIIISISIVITIITSVFVALASPTVPIAFGRDYPFEEDYNRYKEYADIYIETFNKDSIESDEFFNITSNIKNDYIKITVDGTVSKVVAKYPIKVENDDKNTKIVIIKDATYENYSNVESPIFYFSLILMFAILQTFALYALIIFIYDIIYVIIEKIKEKKHKEEDNI